MTTPTTYTDLCAQGEAALTTIKRLRKYDWQDWAAVDVEDAAQIVAGVPALIAAIRELEAQKRDLALDVLAASGQAQDAYEAQLAAEATVATLTAQVEAMRGAKVFSATHCSCGMTGPCMWSDCKHPWVETTTENQTNG